MNTQPGFHCYDCLEELMADGQGELPVHSGLDGFADGLQSLAAAGALVTGTPQGKLARELESVAASACGGDVLGAHRPAALSIVMSQHSNYRCWI